MYNKVWSAGLMGIEGFLVEVEVDIQDDKNLENLERTSPNESNLPN